MVRNGLPTTVMLRDLVEEVMDGGWPGTEAELDAFLGELRLTRADTLPGYPGRAFRLTGERELDASFVLAHTYDGALVGLHILGNGMAQDVQRVCGEMSADLTEVHGPPRKDYDRRRPPSEASHWLVGPARISVYCHADYQSAAMTLQLALEHVERTDQAEDDFLTEA
ncbi:hypothetical protein [Ornithinimicrobium cryptoxanthini]|uniref:SUKH-3 immunity protein of toxin-antitoxin system n=1 Tax=Ornithinimicrobium cryptoxanthini TaxID=2934161 RepID=A0ABY4YMH9_9MICO|nr:hypothetical protein [Ornithinimicrobium cryptoxanthini]USQ77933.1 hypothetical protein NF557_08620 [Ornithinimicrobium cryptoxanthini]